MLWAQSAVADPGRRAILADLQRAHHLLAAKSPEAPETTLLLQGYYNLLRLWAEP
ncbi:MAG: hypothetical protein IT564_04425 [Rhodospirillales bacterium]|nr:hypothetical protein [Rhodospirillales bacterium]